MKYNTQTDMRWANEIMTHPTGQAQPDYLWRWGCIVSSLANILQHVSDKELTPKDMNDIIKQIHAYRYLDDPATPINRASEIVWDRIQDYFSSTIKIKTRLNTVNYVSDRDYYFIARVIHPLTGGGHYVNVINKTPKHFYCFDVEDGEVKAYEVSKVTYLHQIRKI